MDWGNFFESVTSWIGAHGLRILLIISLSFLFYRLIKMALDRGLVRYVEFREHHHAGTREDRIKRAKTLASVLTGSVGVFMFGLTVFMLLAELGIDIAPLLASAGVLGIAIGFGAQSIIKDTLNGLFILLEGQFNTGDVVKVAGVSGNVEDLNLRRTVLRDLDGIVHIIPNGQITTVSNYTHEWARVNLNVPVAYSTDLDQAAAVINRVGRELAADPEFSPMIISAPQVLRVDNFADSAIEIKVLGDVHPMKQWPVTGELRRRLKKAFDEAGIEIPFPHTKLFFDDNQLDKYARLSFRSDAGRRSAEGGIKPIPPARDNLPPDTEP
ncbi:mechanosensitive ion channel family protein [Dehalogenimonas sp. 4OHTPN]|uniref:Mechanosensitive ion channel family protein n=1 Tax=Dehalogenimonas sp. 4OHTPN TaxID=3166643 RepID=A0AAU8G959_9CHLR